LILLEKTLRFVLSASIKLLLTSGVVFVARLCILQGLDIFQMVQLFVSLPIIINTALLLPTVIPLLHPKEEEGIDKSNNRGDREEPKGNQTPTKISLSNSSFNAEIFKNLVVIGSHKIALVCSFQSSIE
jgi:hypothetical protein